MRQIGFEPIMFTTRVTVLQTACFNQFAYRRQYYFCNSNNLNPYEIFLSILFREAPARGAGMVGLEPTTDIG